MTCERKFAHNKGKNNQKEISCKMRLHLALCLLKNDWKKGKKENKITANN